MDPNVNPDLAADLSKPSNQQLAADLSRDAIEARAIKARLTRAAKWARAMNRSFKGISGSHSRRGYIEIALKKHNLTLDDVERVT